MCTAAVFKAIARIKHRLLAHHTRARHLFNIAVCIGDFPITPPQRHHIVAAIENRDVIAKHIIVFGHIALLGQITWLNCDFYIIHKYHLFFQTALKTHL